MPSTQRRRKEGRMVKKNELRVGNWIADHEAGGYFQIEEIRKVGNQYNVSYREGSIKCAVDVLDPIPLTEEWLVKLGFKKHLDTIWVHWSKESGLFQISTRLPQGSYGLWVNGTIGCFQYVHQLQNLYFALRGQELEIKEGNNE